MKALDHISTARAFRMAYLLAVLDPDHKIQNIKTLRQSFPDLGLADTKFMIEACMTWQRGAEQRRTVDQIPAIQAELDTLRRW